MKEFNNLPFEQLILEAARKNNVDPELVKAIIQNETAFNENNNIEREKTNEKN